MNWAAKTIIGLTLLGFGSPAFANTYDSGNFVCYGDTISKNGEVLSGDGKVWARAFITSAGIGCLDIEAVEGRCTPAMLKTVKSDNYSWTWEDPGKFTFKLSRSGRSYSATLYATNGSTYVATGRCTRTDYNGYAM